MNLGRFVFKVSLVTGVTALLLLGVFLAIKPDPQHYYQGSLLKLHLLETVPSPRIILVGGSNIAWGVDSQMIKDELEMSVINDGLDVHLGVIPLLELKSRIRKGDVIIISLEYYNFASIDDFFGSRRQVADWIEFSPTRVKYVQNPVVEALPFYDLILQRKINRQLNMVFYGDNLSEFRGIYTGQHFNEYGDFTGHLNDPISPGMNAEYGGFPLNSLDEAFEYLRGFKEFIQSQGATIYYEAPASRETNCQITGMKYIRRFYKVLESKTAISLLTAQDEICYPDDYFYDTPYHLNAIGREVRTRRLIQNLKKALGESQ